MEGWIKLHRKLIESPVVCKDCETLSIWIYLLLNATYQEIPARFKGEKITLKPGQLITGTLSISKKLLINKDKVQRTLKCFELDKQIEQQTSNKNRLITILKWDLYQSNDKQVDKQLINNCETTDKQLDNKQEYKEYNNIYLYLFNIYKAKMLEEPKRSMQIISELRNSKEYNSLSIEEQEELFYDLLDPQKRELL